MRLSGIKIAVTGATGFIATHLVNKLVADGQHVRALARQTSNLGGLVKAPGLEICRGDIMDPPSLLQLAEGMDVLIHCAAALHFVPKDKNDIRYYYDVNIGGTENTIKAAVQCGVKQFIHISSTAAMGDYYNAERDETAVCAPESDYGKSKLGAEQAVNEYQGKLPITIIRPGVVYGPGDRGTVLKMIRYIDKGIFRHIGDGLNRKTLVAVENVVESVRMCVLNEKAYGETFLIVDQESRTMREIVDVMAGALGKKVGVLYVPKPVGILIALFSEVLRRVSPINLPFTLSNMKNFTASATFSVNKIKQRIGYRQTMSFEDGIRAEVEWYQQEKAKKR